MRLSIELQRQLLVFDIPPCTIKCSRTSASFILTKHKIAVCGAADPGGAGDHIHRIIVVHFPQVVNEEKCDPAPVCQLLQDAQVPVIAGVGIGLIAVAADSLENIGNHQRRIGVNREELLDLLLQTLPESCGDRGEEQVVRRVIRDVQQPPLNTSIAVLQAEAEHASALAGVVPDRFAL